MNKQAFTTVGSALLMAICLAASPITAASLDGVMMKDSKMMVMKDGNATGPMEHEMSMTNGTKVMMDGTTMMKDGTKGHMKNGQMMTMDGKMMEGSKASRMQR